MPWKECSATDERMQIVARRLAGEPMAERVGFEPTSPVLPGYPLSRRALSTAQTPLHTFGRS
jgi:hypothetical protein